MTSVKTKTPKSRNDTAVQGTNDSSIVSKCSMARHGYFKDDFLVRFVSKTSRRAPLIHRGYFIRAKATDYILKEFLRLHPNRAKQIISLGAGFDSNFFRLKSQGVLDDTVYVELDFPDVVRRKRNIILQTEELKNLVNTESHVSLHSDIALNTDCFKLIGVDLTQLSKVETILSQCEIKGDNPTLLLSECVLTYVTAQSSTNIIRWACQRFSQATFVLYEQINPHDAFGQVMVNHFSRIGSPLRCIDTYPTIQSQLHRFKQAGWDRCEVQDMNQFYNLLVPKEERWVIENLEPFDEFEEWHLKCAHYVILCGYNNNMPSLLHTLSSESSAMADSLSNSSCQLASNNEKYLAKSTLEESPLQPISDACSSGNGYVPENSENSVTEGKTANIEVESQCIDLETERKHQPNHGLRSSSLSTEMSIKTPGKPQPKFVGFSDSNVALIVIQRFGHRSVTLGQYVVTVGGFGNEANKHGRQSNVIITDQTTGRSDFVTTRDDIRLDRMYHSMVAMETHNSILVLGGRHSPMKSNKQMVKLRLMPHPKYKGSNSSQVSAGAGCGAMEDDMNKCSLETEVHFELLASYQGDMKEGRWRHSAISYKSKVYIFGGVNEQRQVLGDCIVYDSELHSWTEVPVCETGECPTPRHSHSAIIWNNHMVVSGGLDQELQPLASIHLLDLEEHKWSCFTLTGSHKPRYSHTCHVVDDMLIEVGGINLDHTPPGLTVVNLNTGHCEEFELPCNHGADIIMYHKHSSLLTNDGKLIIVGGGGNCFSFGTHFNATPVSLDISHCLQYCLSVTQSTPRQ